MAAPPGIKLKAGDEGGWLAIRINTDEKTFQDAGCKIGHLILYMQDYRDRREPTRVWRRIVIKFLGPRKSWKVRNHGRGKRVD
jgi:hypothetical protein